MSKTEIERHIRSLGLKNKEEYQTWCLKSGFPMAPKKSARKLSLEQQYHAKQIHISSLKKHKELPFKMAVKMIRKSISIPYPNAVYNEVERNYKKLGPKFCAYSYPHREGVGYIAPSLPDGITPSAAAELYLEVLLYLDSVGSKLTTSINSVDSISDIVSYHEKWLRPYNTWIPKSHNMYRQLSSFVRHLLAKYKIPAFMYSAWEKQSLNNKSCYQDWFCHMGEGKNIRTAKNLFCPLSKKEAHFFLKAPDNYTIPEAVRWGQVHALGGNIRLMNALRETKLIDSFFENDFCLQVIRFFIKHPMLDIVHVNPIIDYIWNQKFQQRRTIVDRGREARQGPPQPNFSMTGRTPESLLKQVERWHKQLGKESMGRKFKWVHSKYSDFTWKQGKAEKGNLKEWRIDNLISRNELAAEGRAMKNCVASYSDSCARGACSIWSLTLNGKRLITLEVKRSNITQMRGKYNRTPDNKEMSVIKKWAQLEGISIASYLN